MKTIAELNALHHSLKRRRDWLASIQPNLHAKEIALHDESMFKVAMEMGARIGSGEPFRSALPKKKQRELGIMETVEDAKFKQRIKEMARKGAA